MMVWQSCLMLGLVREGLRTGFPSRTKGACYVWDKNILLGADITTGSPFESLCFFGGKTELA